MFRNEKGFSLVELSIVVLIMGLLLGGLMMPLSMQRENARFREANEQIQSTLNAIEGFAIVNGYLPCPATDATDGISAPAAGGCTEQHGFVPATTLGLEGRRNDDNLMLDPWGSPIRYSISSSDANSDGTWDFVTAGEMQIVTMSGLQPDLVVCSTAAGSSATDCAGTNETLTLQAPIIVYSLGKDWTAFSSADQMENVGSSLGGGGTTYAVADDNVFVTRSQSHASGAEFDDLVAWLSPLRLYGKLVDAGHLP